MVSHAHVEIRSRPSDPALLAEARANPNGWVYEVDFTYSADEHTPAEAIVGAWEVSSTGVLTGRFQPNERYRPIVRLKRNLPAYLIAAAKHNPKKWVSEIDKRGEAMFPDIPDELIVGWWLISPDGSVSETFRPNSLYNQVNNQEN